MEFIFGQLIGVVVLIIAVVSAQFKNVKHILIGDIAANLTIALSYVLLGGLSGAWMCIVATVQGVIIYVANEHQWTERLRNILTVMFAGAYVVGTVVVYQNWGDIVSCVCALLFVLAIIQKTSAKYRWFKMANTFLWIVYDLTTAAFVNALTHCIQLVSLVTAKYRLDRKKK